MYCFIKLFIYQNVVYIAKLMSSEFCKIKEKKESSENLYRGL